MKQVLLLAVIHLLIFHQYKKDKSEKLSPEKKNKPVKEVMLPVKQDYLFRAIEIKTNDSLLLSRPEPVRPSYINYPSLAIQLYTER